MKTKRILVMLLTFVMLITSVIAAPVTAEAKTKKPAATSIVSLVSKKDKPTQMIIKWKKKKAVKGYQIQYSTSKKFTKKARKTVKIKKASTKKYTIYKLKPNKKYYFRIRTYKVTKGTTVYSKWSPVKSKKTKTSGTTNPGNNDGKPVNDIDNPTTTEPDNTTPVDPATCKHNWITQYTSPATYESDGFQLKCCSKCHTVKRDILPKLTFNKDLNTAHYATPKTLYGENGPHKTNSSCKDCTPTLKYGTVVLTLEYQKERPKNTQHTWCTVCDCDLQYRFYHDRYYYEHYPNLAEGQRFAAFLTCIGMNDMILSKYESFKSYGWYDSYIHVCEDFNNNNNIWNDYSYEYGSSVNTWFYKTYETSFYNATGCDEWTDYRGKTGKYGENGSYKPYYGTEIPYAPDNTTLDISKTEGVDPNINTAFYTAAKTTCKYTGYYWTCPNCCVSFPAYHKDGTMAGVPTDYKTYTIKYEYPYEWTTGLVVKTVTEKKCNSTETANLNKKYNVITNRLKDDMYFYNN